MTLYISGGGTNVRQKESRCSRLRSFHSFVDVMLMKNARQPTTLFHTYAMSCLFISTSNGEKSNDHPHFMLNSIAAHAEYL